MSEKIPRIALCTLCLNEAEFLVQSYRQHNDWPGLIAWVFVEGADPKYAEANPAMVSSEGLSVDQTCPLITSMVNSDTRVKLIRHGWMYDANPSQAKTRGRDRYLDILEDIKPDYFIVLDADEFYTRQDQERINELVKRDVEKKYLCWRLTQRHIWRPYSISTDPQFGLEVVGGYWGIRHVRVFRWASGIRYSTNHNWPRSDSYRPLNYLYNGWDADPQCIHLGFARAAREREATNRYYQVRGEGSADGRLMYTECRTAWEYWRPGKKLPHKARVVEYHGQVPECYHAN